MLAVDRLRAEWARAAVSEYLGRAARYGPVERREVKAAGRDDARAVEAEGRALLAAADVGPGDRLVALSPEGEGLDSRGWAKLLAGWLNEGIGRVVFVVGGAGGLSPDVLATAARRLSLGCQTLPHELAQVVLAEQLYRAWTLVRGEPYHK